jgi:chromosome segregation ATPase
MKRITLAALLLAASNAICQTPAKEPNTIQALLTEVRQLRQDIEAMTVASQRVQIALYTLQMQDAALTRSTQRADNARNKCSGAEANRSHVAEAIQRLESALASGKLAEPETKDAQLVLAQHKTELEQTNLAVQACQVAEAEASNQLRTDQAKMSDLQDRIERLDKVLEKLGANGK